MTVTTITCGWCGSPKQIPLSEYRRRQRVKNGDATFFCNGSCATCYTEDKKKKNNPLAPGQDITVECEYCRSLFVTVTGKHRRRFCCTSHASLGSITPTRLEGNRRGGNTSHITNFSLQNTAKVLLSREGWKYTQVKQDLDACGISYEFEKVIGTAIFDLYLPEQKTVVEFDGPEHNEMPTKQRDLEKNEIAEKHGLTLVRLSVKRNTVIPVCED